MWWSKDTCLCNDHVPNKPDCVNQSRNNSVTFTNIYPTELNSLPNTLGYEATTPRIARVYKQFFNCFSFKIQCAINFTTFLCSNYGADKHMIVCPQHETAISEYIYEYQLGTLHVCVLMGYIVKTTMPLRPLVQKIRDDRIPQKYFWRIRDILRFVFIFDKV